jgi:hypothetical protein
MSIEVIVILPKLVLVTVVFGTLAVLRVVEELIAKGQFGFRDLLE